MNISISARLTASDKDDDDDDVSYLLSFSLFLCDKDNEIFFNGANKQDCFSFSAVYISFCIFPPTVYSRGCAVLPMDAFCRWMHFADKCLPCKLHRTWSIKKTGETGFLHANGVINPSFLFIFVGNKVMD